MGKIKYYISRLLNRRPASVMNSFIDKRASVGNGAQIVNSYIGAYSYVYNSKIINCKIGAFSSIAEECTIGGGSHPITWVSTSPVFYSGHNVLGINFSNNKYVEYKQTTIGNDVWIGSKCLIKGGVTIGNGAIVGMGSVVLHDIPPYEIWAGNPARKIRDRFNDEYKKLLDEVKWWEFSNDELMKNGIYFNNIEKFLKKLLWREQKDEQS